MRRPNVVVRVRPLAETGGHSYERGGVNQRLAAWGDDVIIIEDAVGTNHGIETGIRSESFTFTKDILGPKARQSEVYDAVAANLIPSLCSEGFSAFVFAYGQTGTGKTHTIFGPLSS